MKSNHIIKGGKWIKFLMVALFCLMMSPTLSHAFFWGKVKNFSADQVVISPKGKVMSTTKLYGTQDAYRMDGMPVGGKGVSRDLTFLGFQKQNKQYIYNHKKKLYFESRLNEDDILRAAKAYKNPDSEQILGKEKVSGYMCVKKKVTSTMRVMGIKNTSTVILWQSDKFEFPLRTQDENGQIVEFRKIKTNKPSAKLFILPKGYKKVNSMMAVMGMDFATMVGKEEKDDDYDDDANNDDANDDVNNKDVKKKVFGLLKSLF